MELVELRKAAREIFNSALRAVDPQEAIRRAVRLDGTALAVCDSILDLTTCRFRVYVIAIGKAALGMVAGVAAVLGDKLAGGVIAGPPRRTAQAKPCSGDDRWQYFAGGHPLPNKESVSAAQAAFELLRRANGERALVLFLISGGGSAMMEWPLDDRITLTDLRVANELLLSCGARINELNAVRRAFSAVKGGALAARAPQAHQITLIISDTNHGDEASVASGPTLDPPTDLPDPADVLARYELTSHFPTSIARLISEFRMTLSKPGNEALRKHYVLLDNESALEAAAAAARRYDFHTEITNDIVEQPIEEGCRLLLARLQELKGRAPSHRKTVCLISGGEFACPVRGNGVGGRNSETALRCAIEIAEQYGIHQVVALSAGTDGIDGNSPGAGAIADKSTILKAVARGLNVGTFLKTSDSFGFFEKLGDVIVIGPTGTNVRDVRILLASR